MVDHIVILIVPQINSGMLQFRVGSNYDLVVVTAAAISVIITLADLFVGW